MSQDPRLDIPPHIQEPIQQPVQSDKRPHLVVFLIGGDDNFPFTRVIEGFRFDLVKLQRKTEFRLGNNLLITVHDHRFAEIAGNHLIAQIIFKKDAAFQNLRRGAVDLRGHGECVRLNILDMLLDIGIGDADGFGHRHIHRIRKMLLEIDIEEKRRKESDHQRWRHGNQGEQPQNTPVHHTARAAHLTFAPRSDQPMGNDDRQNDNNHNIRNQQNAGIGRIVDGE